MALISDAYTYYTPFSPLYGTYIHVRPCALAICMDMDALRRCCIVHCGYALRDLPVF